MSKDVMFIYQFPDILFKRGIMLTSDEYELLPHEEIQKLREEVEELKRNPMGNVQESEDLKTSMSKLTKAMHHLIEILTKTNDEMVHEFKRTTMSQHFQKISDQNEKIAQALLGMVQLQEIQPEQPPSQDIGAPQENIPGMMETNQPVPPTANFPASDPFAQPNQTNNFDPAMNGLNLPPPEHKKKGLGGLFK